jgi:hypothetical protein
MVTQREDRAVYLHYSGNAGQLEGTIVHYLLTSGYTSNRRCV